MATAQLGCPPSRDHDLLGQEAGPSASGGWTGESGVSAGGQSEQLTSPGALAPPPARRRGTATSGPLPPILKDTGESRDAGGGLTLSPPRPDGVPPATTPRPSRSPDSSRAWIWSWSIPSGPLSTARHSSPSQLRRAMWTPRVCLSMGPSTGLHRLSTVFTPSSTRPAYGWRKDKHRTCSDMKADGTNLEVLSGV